MSKSHTNKPPEKQHFQFGPWKVLSCKSHILESEGTQREKFESELELPQLPEMVFGENYLRIEYELNTGLNFCALDALRLVDAHSDPVKVAASLEWQNARSGCEHIKNVVSPFDWTFTTDYKGSLFGNSDSTIQSIGLAVLGIAAIYKYDISEEKVEIRGELPTVETTSERIDLEKLKRREPIGFFDEIILFEDELSDNGTSELKVKVRVMPSCFFILMRQFIRVDQVMIRVNDTRLYHEAGSNFLLREFSSKEESTSKIPTAVHTDPNEVSKYLITKVETFDKLTLPDNN